MAESIEPGEVTEQAVLATGDDVTAVKMEDEETAAGITEQNTDEDANLNCSREIDLPDDIEVDPATIDKLVHGTLGLFLPNLQKAKGSLNEVLHNQEVLIETIQQENAKFTDSVAMKKLTDTMIKARQYHTKLVNLKKEMNNLMDRSTKLKRRAVKLQQQKQKEELQRQHQIEREQEKERALTAKVVKPAKDDKTEKDPS